jgi:hypothetical protein
MEARGEEGFDLSAAKATALGAAREWGLALEQPFTFSHVSYVAPAGEAVVKVAWEETMSRSTRATRSNSGTVTERFGFSPVRDAHFSTSARCLGTISLRYRRMRR